MAPASSPGCPVCRKPVKPKSRFVPFCSDRCKMVDLGRWFTGEYVIAGEDAIQLDPEELEAYLRNLQADKAKDRGTTDDEGDEPDDHA